MEASMKAFIAEYTFRDKKTNDLKLVKIALLNENNPEAQKKNDEEYDRVTKKLESLGWVIFPARFTSRKDWN
jgi:hypothetical protein